MIIIAADPGYAVLDNHGFDEWIQQAMHGAAKKLGLRLDTVTGTAIPVAVQQQAFQSSCDSKGQP